MRIRPAQPPDLDVLRAIEDAAGAAFREIGMPEIADDEPPSIETLDAYRRAGRAWVAVDDADRPVAYLIADDVDGAVHVEQVSVHPDHSGHGIGRALIDHVGGETLTTFVDVPWNAPYYERLGFRRLTDDELTPGLRAIRAREVEHGLDRWPRVAMRRELTRFGRR